MSRVLCFCLALVVFGQCSLAEDVRPGPSVLLRYNAALSQSTSNGGSTPVRDFEIRCLVTPQLGGFPTILYLMDQSSDDQPWMEQFGQLEFDAEGQPSPRLPIQRHTHDGINSSIGLRFGHFPAYAKLAAGAEWAEGALKYRLLEDKTVQSQPSWQLEISGDQGRRTTLSIQKSNGTIQLAQHRYFVGQGERYDLTLKLEEHAPAEPSVVQAWTKGAEPLLAMKQRMKMDLSNREAALSPEQLKLVKDSLDGIDKAVDGTPFAALAGVIRREVTAGQQREVAVADLAKKFVGRPAPTMSVTPLDGGASINLSKPGRLTVVHFWEYQDKPLSEPYGQIGYLDFLAQKRKGKVQVIGIISDKQLQDPAKASNALRSAKKLREFMNIGYTLGRETEGALAALGDPRTFGVELPLWVVIAADGTILHYRAGFYEVDTNQGLVELDAVIEKALKGQ